MADYMSIFKASQTPNYMNIFHAAQSGQYAAQQQAEQRAQADAAYQQAAKQFSQHVQASQQLEQQQENARAQMMQNLSGLETRPSLLTTEAQPDTVFKQAALAKLNATQAQNRAQNIQNIKQQMGLTGNTPITQAQNNLIKIHLAAQNGDQMAKLYEKIGSFGSGAEDALTLNADKLGSQPLSGEMNYDAAKNPGLYNAGQMAGTLPSMLIGGGELNSVKGVADWAGDSVAKKALVGAANGALANGTYSAAANVAPVISWKETPQSALKEAAINAALGAILGSAPELIGKAIAPLQERAERAAQVKAADAAESSAIQHATDALGPGVSDEKLYHSATEPAQSGTGKITPYSKESAPETLANASQGVHIDQSQYTRYSPENVKKVMDNVSPNFDKLNASNLSANAVRTSDALANALDAAKGVDDPDVTELLSTAKASADTAASDLDRIDRQYFGGNGGDIDALPEDVKAQAQTAMNRISTARSALKDYLGIDLNDYFLPKGFSLGEKYDPIKAGDYKFSAPVRANLGDLEHVDTSEINPNFTDNAVESMQTPKGATQLGRDLRASYSGKENLQLTKGNQLRDIVRGATGGSGKEGDATRRAVSWYLDAKGDTPEAKRAYLQSVLDDKDMRLNPYRDDIQRAMNLPANAQKTADELARYYGEMGAYSESLNTIHNFKDNYAPRIWEKSGGNTTTEMFNKGLSTYTHHSQNRVFDNLADGIKAGYTPKTLDAGDLLSIYNSEMSRVNTNRSLADGLARAGVGGYENGKIKDGWTEVPSLSKKIAVVDKDGNAKIVNRKFLMPKELAKHLNAISEIDHIKAVAPLRGVLSFNQAVKTAELSLSAFHDVTMVSQALYNNAGGIEFIRHLNLMHSTNSEWFQDAEQFAAKMGVTTAKNADNIDVFMHLAEQNGTKAQLLKQPVIKQIVGASEVHTNFLFGTIQRWLKVTDFSMKAADWDAKHMDASIADRTSALRSIAGEVNAAYGGLNWKALGISPSVRSFMHVGLLAPDWTTSSVLSVGQALTKGAGGTAARRNLVFGLLGSALLGEGLNKILTGHFTDKNPKGHELDIEVSPNVYISPYRSGIGDLAKWIGNTARFGAPAGTVQTISNKESPFLKTLTGLTSNRDYYGSQIYNQKNSAMQNTANIANYLLSEDAPVPFGVESLPKVAKDTTLSTPQKVLAGTLAGTGTGTYSKSSATAGEPYAGNWLYGLTPQGRAENELNQKYTAFTKAQSAATKAKEAKSASYQAKKAAEAKYTEQVKHYMGLSKKGRAMYYNALTPAEKAALNAQLQQSGVK